MKPNLGYWLLVLMATGLACGGRAPAAKITKGGDRLSDTVKPIAVVQELAKETYQGRQAGSSGGAKAAEYIASIFAGIGIEATTMEFRENAPLLVRKPGFSVSVPGDAARTFEFRKDYRDVTRGAWVGQRAVGPIAFLSSASDDFPKGAVVVISGQGYDNENDEIFLERGAVGLLVILDAPSIERRATYPGQDPHQLALPRTDFVKMAVSEALAGYLSEAAEKGATVTLDNPLGFEERTCRNILASWNGDGGKFEPSLMFAAHYDHIGADFGGMVFPGALDNASGVALLLSMAENYSKDGIKQDVAFLLTDSEEINLSGASDFAGKAPFKMSVLRVLNFDMVGGSGSTIPSIYSNGDKASIKLANDLERALSEAGIETKNEYPVPNVDSGPLGRAGAAAVTLCEFDEDAYHTHRDTLANVSGQELDKLENAIYPFALGLGEKKSR